MPDSNVYIVRDRGGDIECMYPKIIKNGRFWKIEFGKANRWIGITREVFSGADVTGCEEGVQFLSQAEAKRYLKACVV